MTNVVLRIVAASKLKERKNNGNQINVKQSERIDCLVNIIKEELIKEYDKFIVKIIQLYYNDNYTDYQYIKEEDITNLVCL